MNDQIEIEIIKKLVYAIDIVCALNLGFNLLLLIVLLYLCYFLGAIQ